MHLLLRCPSEREAGRSLLEQLAAMEVEVLGVNGVPKDAIISIRAGASRRQAPISALGAAGAPFRFAGGPSGVNPFKLDVLQPIGSTRLALKPGGGNFTVPIGSDGVTVNIVVREATPYGDADLFDRIDMNRDGVISRREWNDALAAEGDKPVLQPLDGSQSIPVMSPDGKNRLPPLPKEADLRFPAAATAAKEYLEKHELLSFVRALLQTVVRERPMMPTTSSPISFATPLMSQRICPRRQLRNSPRRASRELSQGSCRPRIPCWMP